MNNFLIIATMIFSAVSSSQATHAASSEKLWQRIKEKKTAVFIRHALAPGTGDPSHFSLKDCSTQRNLNEVGRQQAKQIGHAFRNKGVKVDKVYTSQWCRCKETAELMGLGKPEELSALNSFFELPQNKEPQMKQLRAFMKKLAIDNTVVLVTHYVVIAEYTGAYPSSGEAVVVEFDEKRLPKVVGTIEFPH